MADFKNLNLAKPLQSEDEEDELDRLMAANDAPIVVEKSVQVAPAKPADGFNEALSDLLSDDDDPTVPIKSTTTERKKARHVPTPRARATAKDAVLLAFLGKFRVATAESLSLLQVAGAGGGGNLRREGGELMAVKTVCNRLEKLERLGLVQAASMKSYPLFYGTTSEGVAIARAFGYLLDDEEPDGDGVSGISAMNVPHRLAASHVAAQFMSPRGYFKRHLGVEPLSLDQLISERTIRRYREVVQVDLDADKAAEVGTGSFGHWRQTYALRDARNMVNGGRAPWSEVMEFYPALWSLGWTSAVNARTKDNHDPDLVLNLEDQRKGEQPVSIFVEVEISTKPKADLERILRTYANEFAQDVTYKQVVYFVGSEKASQIKKSIERVDAAHQLDLVKSGRLVFLPLTARDGRSPMTWLKARSQAR